ncbi:probable WRKY transcription factor 65 [Zingiber officinale]|uniref:WRKY domain-containing protein n=1 Tax=Zingiber officinale TaxID=94328 RepID=A0A8J5BZS5_ZINOF|nr:probable WRKY transcription factor 65 [Zingiber officinale]KAG6469493.1 hypothetical protein ZIOFF_074216 [Zingiber officinale]
MNDELDTCEAEEEVGAAEAGSGDESRPPAQSSVPSPKRSRREVEKRVVTVPISETKGSGEGAPPPDSWAWRKYGQKPIKGSPYPRGYYRCSSSKGCPARKQVERSRLEPSMIVVTYSFDHNHPWPLPKNHHHNSAALAAAPPQPLPQGEPSPPESIEREEDTKFSDLISEEGSLLPVDVYSTASPSAAGSSELLYGSVFFSRADAVSGAGGAAALPEEREEFLNEGEEDSLFAGLGELPEYSVVLRRELASTSWVGTTG